METSAASFYSKALRKPSIEMLRQFMNNS